MGGVDMLLIAAAVATSGTTVKKLNDERLDHADVT